jgi:hypothetical protein
LKRITIDLSEKNHPPVVYAVQGEKNSRKIRFDLFQNGMAYEIDQESSVLISYKKSDGHGGMYDVLENGEPAFEFPADSTNSVIITLAEQVLTTAGNVSLVSSFVSDEKILSTFNICLDVAENPGMYVAESEDYFSLSVAIDAAAHAAADLINANVLPVWVSVTEEDGNYTSSHSYSEILTAYENDQTVYCRYNNLIFPLISATHFSCTFGMIHYAGEAAGGYKNYRISIHPNGTVQVSITPLEIPTTSGGLTVTDDGNGNVSLTAYGSASITDDGEGHVRIIAPGITDDGNGNVKINSAGSGGGGTPGKDGGYYTPSVSQPEAGKVQIAWSASQDGMADVETKEITLPVGPIGPQGEPGPKGDTYQLTPEDKQEIAGMVDVPGSGGVAGGALETIIDFTTTEDTVEFQIPIETEEQVAKLRSATEIRIYAYVPRDEKDTETSTSGTATIGLNANTWKVNWLDADIIPPPLTTYKGYGALYSIISVPTGDKQGIVPCLANTVITIKNTGGSAPSQRSFTVNTRLVSLNGTSYFYVSGSQNMAAGTKLIVEVRA